MRITACLLLLPLSWTLGNPMARSSPARAGRQHTKARPSLVRSELRARRTARALFGALSTYFDRRGLKPPGPEAPATHRALWAAKARAESRGLDEILLGRGGRAVRFTDERSGRKVKLPEVKLSLKRGGWLSPGWRLVAEERVHAAKTAPRGRYAFFGGTKRGVTPVSALMGFFETGPYETSIGVWHNYGYQPLRRGDAAINVIDGDQLKRALDFYLKRDVGRVRP